MVRPFFCVIEEVLSFYGPLCGTYALRGLHIFLLYGFTDLICLPTSGASGGSIFLLVKKDRAAGGCTEKRMPVKT